MLKTLLLLRSLSKDDESCRVIQPTKKCTKVAQNVICIFYRSKTSCKKQDETQRLFLEDLVLFMEKWFSPLNTCGCVKLILRLDSRLVFPFQRTWSKNILPTRVAHYLDLHVWLQLDATPIIIIWFVDEWG
jgi:hypothetical protein